MFVVAKNITVYAFLYTMIVTALSSLTANLDFLVGSGSNTPFAKWSGASVLGENVTAYVLVWKSGMIKLTAVYGKLTT